jgi:PAS domain S-box-containing protein/diguanylate cyclase (GGDEF)-like protein
MTKILVVDDNEINRKLVVQLLRYEGHEIAEAADGAEALKIAQREHPQLVISDILMPSMDGYELVRRLRREPALAQTTVIFYTANYHELEARQLAEQCGVARVIVKPCDSAEFVRAVNQALEAPTAPPTALVEPGFDAEHLRLLTDKLSQKAEELSATNACLTALIDLNVQLASERDPQVLLERVCQGARTLIGARYAVLAVTGRGVPDVHLFSVSGVDFGAQGAPQPLIDAGVLGRVFHERRAWRAVARHGPPIALGLPAGYPPPASSFVAVPLSSLTKTYGWLCLVDKIGAAEFSATDERMLTILGAQVGRIYENGSLYLEVQSHAAQLLVEIEERERAASSLRASEERFRQLAETIQDVFFITSEDLSKVLYISPAFERIWGIPVRNVLEHPLVWFESLHPADRERVLAERERLAAAWPKQAEIEFRILRPDGDVRWVLSRYFPVRDEQGRISRVVGVSTDVTDRKVAAEKIIHLNRVHAMLSGINSLIVRLSDRGELFHEACRLAVEQGGFRMAWCGWLDEAGKELHGVAWSGEHPEFAAQMRVILPTDHADDALVAKAMRTRRPGICNDLRDTQARVLYREELAARGFRSVVALPLAIGSVSVGCLVLIAAEADIFDEDEMQLLTELSGDISFALDHIEKAERLNYLARYDVLTGLANRPLFLERLQEHVRQAATSHQQLALVIVNPERLESVSETVGGAAADELLRELGTRLARCASPDLLARIASDRLAAVVPQLHTLDEVTATLDQWWRKCLAAPFTIGAHELTLSARAGIALFPTDGADADSLLQNAEAALQIARSRSDRYGFYAPDLSERLRERRFLEGNMRRALEHDEFVLHYQPKVDLTSRRVTGVEALIRWQSPELGLVPPGRFISIMEDNGFIVDIGAWALRQARQDRSRWIEQGLQAPRVAVNVSTVQLRRDDFVRTIGTVVGPAGSQAGIDIEVTESLLMENVEDNLAKLAAIRELGVDIALDDFGTGFSSLGYLAKLPLEVLKIDRSFVSAMLDDPSAMTLVSTIISLAHALNLETVAEGVEHEEQAKILRLLRCDQMQGYLVSKPLPFCEITTYLGRSPTGGHP